jgi:hypothetical protein
MVGKCLTCEIWWHNQSALGFVGNLMQNDADIAMGWPSDQQPCLSTQKKTGQLHQWVIQRPRYCPCPAIRIVLSQWSTPGIYQFRVSTWVCLSKVNPEIWWLIIIFVYFPHDSCNWVGVNHPCSNKPNIWLIWLYICTIYIYTSHISLLFIVVGKSHIRPLLLGQTWFNTHFHTTPNPN